MPDTTKRELLPPGGTRTERDSIGPGPPFDYPATLVGSIGNISVYYDPSLGSSGLALANQLLTGVSAPYGTFETWFAISGGSLSVVVSPLSGAHDGSGGGYHYGCSFAVGGNSGVIYVDATFANTEVNPLNLAVGLYAAELSEMFEGAQALGWGCGYSNGEGLSRFAAEQVTPAGTMYQFLTGPSWATAGKPDWVDTTELTDEDAVSTGCAIVYLYWMVHLGYTIPQIVQAAGATLADNYQTLTGKTTAYADLLAAVSSLSITSDNPWGSGGGGSPTGTLSATGFTASAIISEWQANHAYQDGSQSADPYVDYVIDSNGNLQVCYEYGVSGASPPAWNTTPGGLTTDNSAQWILEPLLLNQVQIGNEITLSWTSTNGISASIDHGVNTVALNGSLVVAPNVSNLTGTKENYGKAWRCAYTLTVTGSDGSATSILTFYLYVVPQRFTAQCFAPVNNSSLVNMPRAGSWPIPPGSWPQAVWAPDTPYTEGTVVRDSNNMAEIALNSGSSGATDPHWVGMGDITTETTGLKWQNLGNTYSAQVMVAQFGPDGWMAPRIGFGFEGAVLPVNATVPSWQANTAYKIGDVVGFVSTTGAPGLMIARCVSPGTSGAAFAYIDVAFGRLGALVPETTSYESGIIIPNSPTWASIGQLELSLYWAGGIDMQPSHYPPFTQLTEEEGFFANVIAGIGDPIVPQKWGPLSGSQINGFYVEPVAFDPLWYVGNSQDVDECIGGTGTCFTCIGLATGYLPWPPAGECTPFLATIYAVWAEYTMPYLPIYPSITPPTPARGCAVMGFTTHDQDITYDAGNGDGPITYRAATGMANTAKEGKSDVSVDGMEVTAFLESDSITEEDIRAGLYDNAEVIVRVVNWADLTMGHMIVMRGHTGTVKMKNGLFTAELRGLSQKLTTALSQTYGELCRADLGSNPSNDPGPWFCNINVASYQQNGAVEQVIDDRTLVPGSGLLQVGSATPTAAAAAGWFNDGIITFTSGVLECASFEIKSWDGTTLTLFLSMPELPATGDTFVIEPGCDKSSATCQAKFQNIANFRGEPFIPGMDQLLDYAG